MAPQPGELPSGKAAREGEQQPVAGGLSKSIYLSPKLSVNVVPPKIVSETKRSSAAAACASLVSPGRILPPLEGPLGHDRNDKLRSSLQHLKSLKATFAEPHMAELTPESPKQQLAPLARKSNALSPPLRGSMVKPRVEVFEAAEPSGSSRGPVASQLSMHTSALQSPKRGTAQHSVTIAQPLSPGAHTPTSPPKGLVPSTSMAPIRSSLSPHGLMRQPSASASQQGPASPSLQQLQQGGTALGASGMAKAGAAEAAKAAAASQLMQEDYNYMKLVYTLRQYPATEDFVYLRRFDRNPAHYNPYALQVVAFAALPQDDYYTMSVRGVTHHVNGANADFTSLDQWEREVHLFIALKQLALFRQHKLYKAFAVWRRAVCTLKISLAKAHLEKNLFALSPVFQGPLQAFHDKCVELSRLRLHNLSPGQVYTLQRFVEAHETQHERCNSQLAAFAAEVRSIVEGACTGCMDHLEQHLESYCIRPDAEGGAGAAVSAATVAGGRNLGHAKTMDKQQEQDFAYTMAASRRSEQRRLINYIRMSDYMMTDTLHSILVASVADMLSALSPPQHTLDGPEQMAAMSKEAERVPVFEVVVNLDAFLLEGDGEGLAFDPQPADFQAHMVSILGAFQSSACSLQRLSCDAELVGGVLGGKPSDLEDVTPLQELVVANDYEDLVQAVKERLRSAFFDASEKKDTYKPFQDMVLYDADLDIDELAPAFREHSEKANSNEAPAIAQQPGTSDNGSSAEGQQQQHHHAYHHQWHKAQLAAYGLDLSAGPVTLNTFSQLLDLMAEQKASMEALPSYTDVGIVRVSLKALRESLLPWPLSRLQALHEMLPRLAAELFDVFSASVVAATGRLSGLCTCVEEYVAKLQFLAEMVSKEKAMDAQCAEIQALYALMSQYGVPIPEIDRANHATLESSFTSLKVLMDEVENGKEENFAKYSNALLENMDAVAEDVKALRAAAQNEAFLSEDSEAGMMLKELRELRAGLEHAAAEVARVNSHQRLFKLPEATCEDLAETLEEVNLKLNLWTTSIEFEELTTGWRGAHFDALDMPTMETTVAGHHKTVFRMERGLPSNKLVPKLRARVDEYRALLPVVTALKNKALKDRHWGRIFEAVGSELPRDATFTLQVLLDAKVVSVKDAVLQISTEATQESALEELLTKVTSKWATIEFNVVQYKDSKDVYILGAIDDIQVALEDSLVTMSTVLASRFVTGIRAEVERVERQLTTFADTLDQWVQVQKAWMYLEPIFSAPDIQKQLPIEFKAFEQVHRQLREIMRRTKDRPNALATSANPTLLETLSKSFETLEAIQKSLEEYLETKRVAFPRFYFLSNDELLEILAQTKNVQAVQPHMGKCFDGIRRLDFGDEPKSIDIFAICSGEGERVSLGKNPLKARGNVETWLSSVESAMVSSLRRLAKGAMATYPEEPRAEWVLHQPAQLVIAISQVFWCAAVEECLRSSSQTEELQRFLQQNVRQLADLTRLVRGELTPLARASLAALITIDVHARDILESLLSKGTASTGDFEWAMQLRYYWENDDIVVRQVNARFTYAYEYLGAQARLVVTPMTDRCYLTLTGALHLKLGGAPAGPAGTGKTETTKDLGKALGVACVVFNCGDNLDFKFMGKFFAGLAQCGAWACFDEFNRIDIEVLSVVAQQLLTIQNALKAGVDKFWFEGRPIKLVPTCGVFITMNPGYAGRTELPDNLKALFRPMAMMIPDYALVAEVMLFSEGFEDSKALSRKMVKLYKLASEQLSQQDHYDFGMRAVKSVLVMAGALKRAAPDLPEEAVLIRAMRDSNLPKFLSRDVELFQNIIGDLFPGVSVPDQDYGELDQSVRAVLEAQGLQQTEPFVTKVVQLYETMNVRFGVMLVGPTGGGKTTCCRALQGALTRLRTVVHHGNPKFQVTHTYTINPKCIKMGELYGEYNLLTNEWTDGLGSTLIRSAVTDTSDDRKWVVFDGPVDAIWIENMNTVLDDNCTLCLPNGERIKLNANTMRMLFEVQDLAVASPATVSRCGMVYIALEELGWRPAVQTWASKTLPEAVPLITPQQCSYIYTLFDTFVEAGLQWVRTEGSEYIPSVDNNLTTTLAMLIQSLLDPSKGIKLGAAVSPEDFERIGGCVFGFAFVWALGGNLSHTVRDGWDAFCREHLQRIITFPGGGTVYDYQLHLTGMMPDLRPWADSVPHFTYNKALPYFQMLVPTVDTVRYAALLEMCVDVQRSVLFTGVTGVGKSVITAAALEGLRERKNCVPFTINFSAQTSSLDTQLLIESKLEKKRKTRFGAPANKRIVLFVDDVNMPAREKYGAQPPVELLRQFQDFHGFYDRKKLFWKDVEDTLLVAACAPPGGGRQEVTPRFFRHFTMLSICPPSDASTKTILSSILTGYLADFQQDLRLQCAAIVNASVEAYNRISEELLPSPAKSHYTFNLRDLSKVFQGLLMGSPSTAPSREALHRLWLHEECRVFHDRLVSQEDREYFKHMLVELSSKHGLGSASYDELFGEARSPAIMWGDFLRQGVERGERVYEEVKDAEKLSRLLEDSLDEYNMSHTGAMNLVFFQDAIEHVVRMSRILRQPRGNAMLVGVGGSGKQSLTRFAAHLSGFKVVQIELSRGYGHAEFREDLRKLYRCAGVAGEPVVFLLSDTQITDESFLEDVNNMLNSGEVPGMFANDEKDRIITDIREWVEASGQNPSKDGCWTAFINRVRDNLHIVLTMSPVGDSFRARCRQFPSLINCCTIDWFSQWPEAALLSVSSKFLAATDLGSEAIKSAIARMCVSIHTSVEAASARFYAQLRRRYYTTPKSYLDLIGLYLQLLKEKRDELSTARDRLLNGLNKLSETNTLVEQMKAQLAQLAPVLEVKAKATQELLARVTADQAEAEKVKVVVAAEEKDVKAMQAKTQAIADDAKADLDEALPALNAALESLSALNKNDIVEIKSFPKPPPLVQLTMEAVCILKQEKPDWDTAKRVLGDSGFMKSLEEFDKDNIPDSVIKRLKKYIDDPNYTPEAVAKQSRAAMSLCMWTRAMDVYNRVSKVVEPKRMKLRGAEEQLEAANRTLRDKQQALAAVEARVAELQRSLAEAQHEQRTLSDQAELTKKRLERAGKLTSALADEGIRWQTSATSMQAATELLVGDVFLSAACIAYYGAFTGAYRQELVAGWVATCQELHIPVSPDCTLRGTLASPVEVREWVMAGLPTDEVSIDNGILVTRGKRWPLMIDPQGQAGAWVKAMEAKSGLRVIKLSDPSFLRSLENCIRIGNPALIEDVGESLDPALEPVLQRAVFKQGGRLLIRLGDSDVDYDPSFKLYITTKLSNPHYMPETCIKVTLINFTVTMPGLEDQLLGEVVRKERPELEEQRDRLVVSISADKRQLQDLEDKILKLLKESEGNILDDEQLIATLNNSKLTSQAIQNRVKEAEETERSINEARESYRSAATRGSILYFVIADLAAINPMYQFSLSYFSRLFSTCIDNSDRSNDVAQRLQLLSDYITHFMFNNVSRGLFEEHKLLYSFLMCTSILRHASSGPEITEAEWSLLTRGPVGPVSCQSGSAKANPAPNWISKAMWEGVVFADAAVASLRGLADSLNKDNAAWQTWFEADEPHQQPLPGDWQPKAEGSGAFVKLLLVKLLREEKLVFAAQQYVADKLGKAFTEPAPWSLDDVFPDSSCHTPVIFILSTGADPTSMLQRFAERKGWSLGQRLHMISLGQGQGAIAESMMKQAASNGDWVCLQNCHLASSWMLRLEEKVDEMSHEDAQVHPDFRLWLTSMPSAVFPVPVLQNGIKLTNEPPKGVKANVGRTYNDMGPENLDSCPAKPSAWRRLLFTLSFFHAVVQERRKFGPLGWNIRYEFNASDLECSSSTLRMFLSESDAIPWDALEYVIGQINYGGRVTDDLDRRCLMSVLRQYVAPRVVQIDNAALVPSGTYRVPHDGTVEDYRDYLRALPSTEAPEVFGMHANANLAFQLQETRRLMGAVLSIQPRATGSSDSSSSGGSDAVVGALAAEILVNLPADLSESEALPGLFERTSAGQLNSLSVVLGQEMERFNRLAGVVRSSLGELQKAIRGLVVMSSELEGMYNAMLSNQVPELWARVAYPSLKPLGSWVTDFHARVAFMRDWLANGPPRCFWLPGFFFPQGFMTGVLQQHARKYAIPIDTLSFEFQVTEHASAESLEAPPSDGIYVSGLWIDGARWDTSAECLEESEPGVMYAPLPIIHFKPGKEGETSGSTPGQYSCPLYKTSVRAGVLSTTGQSTNFVLCVSLPVRKGTSSDFWVLQGVALLCMLDT